MNQSTQLNRPMQWILGICLLIGWLPLPTSALAGTWGTQFGKSFVPVQRFFQPQINLGGPGGAVINVGIEDETAFVKFIVPLPPAPSGVGFIQLHPDWKTAWRDYTFQFRLRIGQVVGADNHPIVGFNLHDTFADTGEVGRKLYGIALLPDVKELHAYYFGVGDPLGMAPFPADFVLGEWFTLRTELSGARVRVFWNDQPIVAFEDDRSPAGHPAFFVRNAVAWFDDVRVSGEEILDGGDAPAFAVTPRLKLASRWGEIKARQIER